MLKYEHCVSIGSLVGLPRANSAQDCCLIRPVVLLEGVSVVLSRILCNSLRILSVF